MHQDNLYSNVINSWLKYITLEELSNIKIKSDTLTGHNLYKISDPDHCIFSLDQDKLKITITEESPVSKELIKFFSERSNSQDSSGEARTLELLILFPVVEQKDASSSFYLPIFVLKVQAMIERVFSGEVINDLKKLNSSENESVVRYFSTPSQPLCCEINLEKLTDYLVCKPFFTNVLRMSDDELTELPFGKPLLTFLRELLKQGGNKNFFELLVMLKRWLEDKIPSKWYEVSDYDFIFLWDVVWQEVNVEKIKTQLKILSDKKFDPRSDQESAAYKYLYGKQRENFDDYNTPDDTHWYGTFDEFPLSKGQALVLQKFAKRENLIACQGPPGTGKTTLLMALVADILTRRALSIAVKREDFSSIILVCSTANKAVENAAKDFKSCKKFWFSELHANCGFYFIGGKRENVQDSLNRINVVKEWLLSYEMTDVEEEFREVKAELVKSYEEYEETVRRIKGLKERYANVLLWLDRFNKEKPKVDERKFDLEAGLARMEEVFIKKYGLGEWQLSRDYLLIELEKARRWWELYRSSRLSEKGIVREQFSLLTQRRLKESVISCYSHLKDRSFLRRVIDFFTRQDRKMINDFILEFREIIDITGYEWIQLVERERFISYLEELSGLIKEAEDLSGIDVNDLFLREEFVDEVRRFLSLLDEMSEIRAFEEEMSNLLSDKERIERDLLFSWVKEGVFEYVRRNWEVTRKLFHLSARFLELYAIKHREKVIYCLELFKQLKSEIGGNSWLKVRDEVIKQVGVEEFYRYISLIYPVHFSSLHSSSYIFDDFICPYFGLQEEFLRSGFKPIYLTFIDEAAMALPHLAYPVVYWSNYVIAVGDPLQIPPVVSIDNHTLAVYHDEYYKGIEQNRFSPAMTTVYHRAAKCETGNPTDIGEACFIDYHRRCQEPIARLFAEIAGYKNLEIATPPLRGKDRERLDKMGGKHLLFYDVYGIRGEKRNTNKAEALAIKSLIKKLQKAGYNCEEEVKVITPYRHQEDLLKRELCDEGLLPERNVGTIHKFQGSQGKVVIFSPVIFDKNDSPSFINSTPNILNVAVSRAEHLFIVVGNYKKLSDSKGHLGKVVEACKEWGEIIYGIEFDETEERVRKKEKVISEVNRVLGSYVEIINGPKEHMKVFSELVEAAKKEFVIVCPWVRLYNVKEFSLPYLKRLESKGVKVEVIFGYSEDNYGDDEALEMLKGMRNVFLRKRPNYTHAKVLVADRTIAVIGSFNWLSHMYYKQDLLDYVVLRDETSVIIRNGSVIDKFVRMFGLEKN